MAKFKFGDAVNAPMKVVGITTPVGPEPGEGPGNVLRYELEFDAGASPVTKDKVRVITRPDGTVVILVAAAAADNFLTAR